MNCKKVRLRLSAYQDGELSSPLSRAVELHMASCAACQSEWAALQALIHSLRRSTPFAEDPGFSSRIMAGLRTRPATKLRLLPSLAYSLALVMIFISGFLLAMSANGLPAASPPTAMTFSAVLAESRTLGLLAVQDSTLEMLSKLKQISLVKKQDNLLSKLPVLPSRVSGDAHEN